MPRVCAGVHCLPPGYAQGRSGLAELGVLEPLGELCWAARGRPRAAREAACSAPHGGFCGAGAGAGRHVWRPGVGAGQLRAVHES